MKAIKAICILLFLGGCAAPLTQDEIDWRVAIDLENWEMCRKIYQQQHAPFIHIDHRMEIRTHNSPWEIRQDLWQNDCRSVLGGYWIEY